MLVYIGDSMSYWALIHNLMLHHSTKYSTFFGVMIRPLIAWYIVMMQLSISLTSCLRHCQRQVAMKVISIFCFSVDATAPITSTKTPSSMYLRLEPTTSVGWTFNAHVGKHFWWAPYGMYVPKASLKCMLFKTTLRSNLQIPPRKETATKKTRPHDCNGDQGHEKDHDGPQARIASLFWSDFLDHVSKFGFQCVEPTFWTFFDLILCGPRFWNEHGGRSQVHTSHNLNLEMVNPKVNSFTASQLARVKLAPATVIELITSAFAPKTAGNNLDAKLLGDRSRDHKGRHFEWYFLESHKTSQKLAVRKSLFLMWKIHLFSVHNRQVLAVTPRNKLLMDSGTDLKKLSPMLEPWQQDLRRFWWNQWRDLKNQPESSAYPYIFQRKNMKIIDNWPRIVGCFTPWIHIGGFLY